MSFADKAREFIERFPTNAHETQRNPEAPVKQPDIIHREGFLVMGTVARRTSGVERPETFASIWNEFETHHEQLKPRSVDSRYYGVSFGVAQDGSFDYLAGMAVGRVEDMPAGLQVRELPAATYAVFSCAVQSIGQTYAHIFGEWRSTSVYELDPEKFAFEQYPPAAETNAPVLIHIPIREKQITATPGQHAHAVGGSEPTTLNSNRTTSAGDSRS